MNFFNYNFKTILLYVEEVYTKLYGEQYRKIIHDRLQAAKYIFYNENSDTDLYEKCEHEDFNDEYIKENLPSIKKQSEMCVYIMDPVKKIFRTILYHLIHEKKFKTMYFRVKREIKRRKNYGLMFFPIYREKNGNLDFHFLHECGHIIDISSDSAVGFDIILETHYVNPSNNYEYLILNEALTDIFAIECRDLLHQSGIYLADKDGLTLDSENCNMRHEIKELVRLLVDNYREEIINAKITGDYNVLFDKIGRENFDRFNLIVNKVQRLIDDGLLNKENPELFKEYYALIEEAETVLNMMSEYSVKNPSRR